MFKKKEKTKTKKKKKGHTRTRSHTVASPTHGNPFTDPEVDDIFDSELDSSTGDSTSSPVSEAMPMDILSRSSGSGRSESIPTRSRNNSSVGSHRPVRVQGYIGTNISPEISSDRYTSPGEQFFQQGIVSSSSTSTSTATSPRGRMISTGSDNGDGLEPSPGTSRGLGERTKTKYFNTKNTYLELDERLNWIADGVKKTNEVQEGMQKKLNEQSSAVRAMAGRITIMLDMMSNISQGARYNMKDHRSIPDMILEVESKRKPPPGCWASCMGGGRADGYQRVNNEREEEEEGEGGWFCFA